MSVDIHGKSKFPEINAHRDRLRAQMEKMEKEGKQDSRKYKKAAVALQKLQVMNFIDPSGQCNFTPEEFTKTASQRTTLADAFLAGYAVHGCLFKYAGEPGPVDKNIGKAYKARNLMRENTALYKKPKMSLSSIFPWGKDKEQGDAQYKKNQEILKKQWSDFINKSNEARTKPTLQKQADLDSEQWSLLNPLNAVAATPAMLVGAMTPTRTKEEQKNRDADFWKNILIPGWSSYNIAKRVGRQLNSREANELLSSSMTSTSDVQDYDRGPDSWGSIDSALVALFKKRSGKEPSRKDIEALKTILKKRKEKTLDPYHSTKSLGTALGLGLGGGLAGGLLYAPHVVGGMEGRALKKTQEWAEKNPGEANKLRKLVRKLSGDYKYNQE